MIVSDANLGGIFLRQNSKNLNISELPWKSCHSALLPRKIVRAEGFLCSKVTVSFSVTKPERFRPIAIGEV